MNNIEFSNQFDVLYNNITSNQAPGLNEYEKSVFLTKALDEVLKNYFNPKSNPKQEGFDDTIKRQADFSGLMREDSIEPTSPIESQYDPRSLVYKIPTEVYLTINELILLQKEIESDSPDTEYETTGIRQIIPLNYMEYQRLMSKPYKEPLKYLAWKLFTSTESDSFNGDRIAEVILTSTDKKAERKLYKIRYIKFPKPIILSDFSESFGEDISINGYNGSEIYYSKKNVPNSKYVAWQVYLNSEEYQEDVAPYIEEATQGLSDQDEIAAATAAAEAAYLAQCLENNPGRYSDVPTDNTTVWDPCELDPVIHEEILQRAVELAKIAWLGDVNTAIQTGLRSE